MRKVNSQRGCGRLGSKMIHEKGGEEALRLGAEVRPCWVPGRRMELPHTGNGSGGVGRRTEDEGKAESWGVAENSIQLETTPTIV
jgi:hypothetical protein